MLDVNVYYRCSGARVALASVVLAAACVGQVEPTAAASDPTNGAPTPGAAALPPGTSPARDATPGAPSPAAPTACVDGKPNVATPARRLTRFEYDNTIRDLLGDTSRPADAFPPDDVSHGFDNDANTLGVTPLLVERYLHAAEQVAERATADLARLLPCDPARDGEEACVTKFIDTFVRRAYRKPVEAADRDSLVRVFRSARATATLAVGVQAVMQVVLQSPGFLYRVELGAPAPGTSPRPLTPWELASRLSYLLWGSMPDDALLAAASAGGLATKADVLAQATRMIKDARFRDVVQEFHRQWLDMDRLARIEKDARTFPTYDPALRDLWARETAAFVGDVVFAGPGTVGALLTAPYTFANARLAGFYGIKGPTGDAFVKVALDAGKRIGVMTQGGLMAALAKPAQSSPVARGAFVAERLLCLQLPPPPNDVAIKPPDPDPKLTTRERFEAHRANPACAGCHRLMDPLGFGFEAFDGIGRYRATENGKPIDTSGALVGTDVDGDFQGAVELMQRLAGSQQVQRCVTRQWFRYASGRAETDADQCVLQSLAERLAAPAPGIQQLLLALTQTDQFMSLPREAP